MRTDFTAALDGVYLHDLNPLIYIEDITEEPKVNVQTENRGSYGLTVVNEPERDQLDIVIQLMIKQPDRKKRQSVISEIRGWAKSGWLQINIREDQQIYVTCTKPIVSKSLRTHESMEITFTAYNEAYWQSMIPIKCVFANVSTGSGSFIPDGTRQCFIEADITNVSGSNVTSISISAGNKTIAFTGITLASNKTFKMFYDERHLLRAEIDGSSVLSYMTDASPDHLKANAKKSVTVSFTASGACNATLYARGLYD